MNAEVRNANQNRIKNVVAVMSGKGGVGKSLVTGLLANGLVIAGYKVGILDADFTGSSIPMLFGLHGKVKTGQYSFLPFESRSGIKIISTNLLFDNDEQPVIWKEALVSNVIKELWQEVEWGELDYFLIDMPSAISETAVAILQSIPFTGAVIVSTPQQVSTKINNTAVRAVQGTGLPIIGIVENMSYFLNPSSGEKQSIFAQHHTQTVANTANALILAHIPFNPEISGLCDSGRIEDVFFDDYADLIDAFLRSLAAIEQKQASEQSQNHSNELTDKATQEVHQEASPHTPVSSSPGDHKTQAFSDTVIYLVRSKENVGVLENPDAQGYFLGSCGDRMQIHLKLINNRILDAKFLADGCGATQACGTMVTKMACSKTLDEAGQITAEALIEALDGLPDDHLHCAELAVMTLHDAMIDAVEGHKKIL
jgi:Mrp family chromosome partitioning ATPase/NifU-like protein involved in Fe-S cluster formation